MTQEEFVTKYNELVKEAGFQIIPQLTLGIDPVTPVEALKVEEAPVEVKEEEKA